MDVAEIKVSYSTPQVDKIKITSSKDCFDLILKHWDMDIIEFQEECKVILVNRANHVLGIYSLSKGGISGTVVDTRIVLSVALKCNASGFVLVHNHPSGNLKASEGDKQVTKRIKEACALLDFNLVDHLIISQYGYLSFRDEGLL